MAAGALHGVNLTGWLTLESWTTPELFADSGVLEEPELVRALGPEAYKQVVETHREDFISENDFRALAARGFNAVRLPVPWYVFGEEGPLPGPFVGCIQYVDQAFDWAEELGIQIVLALDINPGASSIEGELVRGHGEFRNYRDDMIRVLAALARRYRDRFSFYGLEVANAPRVQIRRGFTLRLGVMQHILRNYYRDAYEAIRSAAGDDVVVILPDAGEPKLWKHFMAHGHYKNVWLDSHLFHFGDKIDAVGPRGIRKLAEASARYLAQAKKSGLPVMVGKWSGSLPYSDNASTPEGRIAFERVYIAEQISTFDACPAWFFETWKTTGRLAGWDARVSLATFERRMMN